MRSGALRHVRRSHLKIVAVAAVAVIAATTLTACLSLPGDVSKVVKIDETTVDGWHWDYFENQAYPCSIKGYQTFAIGTKVGSSPTDTRPLWVKMRGGGFGWFADDGTPQPTAGNKSEITLTSLLSFDTPGLMAQVKAAPEGFRLLLVSMCSHDLYAGNNTTDPHNPNLTADGQLRTTNGLIATKAAIQYSEAAYPTHDYFLHGTSAGGAGTFGVAWALQQQGIPPSGLVSDSGVIDQTWEAAVVTQGTCAGFDTSDAVPAGFVGTDRADSDPGGVAALIARVDPDIANPANQPDMLVSRGALTVPVMHVWNHGDVNSCGETPMTCTRRDGTTLTLGAADCRHENLRLAIAAEGPTSKSMNMAVCVEGGDKTRPCDEHVVTTRDHGKNSDPASPVDYQTAIMAWVRARLADG